MFNKTNVYLGPVLLIGLFSLVLLVSGCDLSGGSDNNGRSGAANASDGKTFYNDNCAVCHSAGQDDPSAAFNTPDLISKADFLQTDLSVYGDIVINGTTYSLMEKFNDVSPQALNNLKAYLGAL